MDVFSELLGFLRGLKPEVIVALGSALLAAMVAVIVPVWTFNKTLRLDRNHWLRDQRGQLYIDLLTEAYAERVWLSGRLSRHEVARAVEGDAVTDGVTALQAERDFRLTEAERYKLQSRSILLATPDVVAAYRAFLAAVNDGHDALESTNPAHAAVRDSVDEAFDALVTATRTEMGAHRFRLLERVKPVWT